MMPTNLWDPAKTVYRGKVIALHTCIKEKKGLKINDLRFILRNVERVEQNSPQTSRKGETIKRETINKIEKQQAKICSSNNEQNQWSP